MNEQDDITWVAMIFISVAFLAGVFVGYLL